MNFTTIQALRDYYLHSLEPQLTDYLLMFGKYDGPRLYHEHVAIHKSKPTLTGFIKYARKAISKMPLTNTYIVFKKRNKL